MPLSLQSNEVVENWLMLDREKADDGVCVPEAHGDCSAIDSGRLVTRPSSSLGVTFAEKQNPCSAETSCGDGDWQESEGLMKCCSRNG